MVLGRLELRLDLRDPLVQVVHQVLLLIVCSSLLFDLLKLPIALADLLLQLLYLRCVLLYDFLAEM